jgi:CRISPR/Cas system CSM-associated protein Csm3 (group 7 of RAMP superfamily)
MSGRMIAHRWVLTGSLVAESPVHVGGLGDGPPDLVQARDGLDRPVLPGTSLAGVIRAALAPLSEVEQRLWGTATQRNDRGRDDGTSAAAWVRVDDATALADTATESREHVSIDRIHGTAARGHLYAREVLPPGSRFAFRMVIDSWDDPAGRALVNRIVALLRSPGITVGAATSKGLGHVRLSEAALHRLDLRTRAGIIAALRGQPTNEDVDQTPQPGTDGEPPDRILRIEIPWRPRGPLSVHVSADGDVVDAFPLATAHNGAIRLELPGHTIKGVLRSHAERIVRTVTGASTPVKFLDQMAARGLGPVGALFGTAADRDTDNQPTGRRGALRVATCLSTVTLPYEEWQAVRELRWRAQPTTSEPQPTTSEPQPTTSEPQPRGETHLDALAGLQRAVDDINRKTTGLRLRVAPHVAVDRWTGGAADSLLFATLEPHPTHDGAWQPIVLDLDVTRLHIDPDGTPEAAQRAALVLLLLVLRDMCDGWIGFGHATTRGMGAVSVKPTEVRLRAGTGTGWLTQLHGRSLADILDDDELTRTLLTAWPPQAGATS